MENLKLTMSNTHGVVVGLVGLVLASIVNLFLGSSMLYWLTTFAGVVATPTPMDDAMSHAVSHASAR